MKRKFKISYANRLLSNFIAIILIVSFSCGLANAQIEKGSIFLGTSTSITGGNYDMILGTNNSIGFSSGTLKSGDYDEKYSVFNFSPKLGYFITKNLVLGANMKFWVQKEDEYKTSITAIGPFARYYITDGKIVPFIEAEATFGNYKDTWNSSNSDGESKEKLSIISVGGGLAFFINNFISVDCMVGYKTFNIKESDSDDDDKMTLNNIGVAIGFTATF